MIELITNLTEEHMIKCFKEINKLVTKKAKYTYIPERKLNPIQLIPTSDGTYLAKQNMSGHKRVIKFCDYKVSEVIDLTDCYERLYKTISVGGLDNIEIEINTENCLTMMRATNECGLPAHFDFTVDRPEVIIDIASDDNSVSIEDLKSFKNYTEEGNETFMNLHATNGLLIGSNNKIIKYKTADVKEGVYDMDGKCVEGIQNLADRMKSIFPKDFNSHSKAVLNKSELKKIINNWEKEYDRITFTFDNDVCISATGDTGERKCRRLNTEVYGTAEATFDSHSLKTIISDADLDKTFEMYIKHNDINVIHQRNMCLLLRSFK